MNGGREDGWRSDRKRERGERGEGAKMDGGRGQTTEERTVIISNGRVGRSVVRRRKKEKGRASASPRRTPCANTTLTRCDMPDQNIFVGGRQ